MYIFVYTLCGIEKLNILLISLSFSMIIKLHIHSLTSKKNSIDYNLPSQKNHKTIILVKC